MAYIVALLKNFFSECLNLALRFRKFWNKEPDAAHCFDMMEFMFILGGIRCKSTERLIRLLWHVLTFLTGFQCLVVCLDMFDELFNDGKTSLQIWYTVMVTGLTVSLLSGFIINYNAGPLNEIQTFFCSQTIHSNDLQYDSNERKSFWRSAIRFVKTIVLYSIFQQMVIMVPNAQRDVLFAMPAVVTRFGPSVALAAQFGFRFMFAVLWACKYYCCFGTSSMLMLGLRAEMRILVQRFAEIRNRVESSIREGGFNSRNRIERMRSRASFWNNLHDDVSISLKQHQELLKNFHTIRPFICDAFMFRYYYILGYVGSLLFLAYRFGTAFWFIALVANVLMCLTEVFCWCYLIESFQDVHESIGEIAFDICVMLPHCSEHHLDYVRTRKDLIIIGINTYHGRPMKCAGIFVINMAVFVKLVNTTYTVVTFLQNMG